MANDDWAPRGKIKEDVRKMKETLARTEHTFPLIKCSVCGKESRGGFLHPQVKGPMCGNCYFRKLGI